ncbi:Uma2 family endonuclease [soil metagenome]
MVATRVTDDRPLTIEDLDLIPDDGNRYEIMQGELIVSPAPNDTHQLVLGRLYIALLSAANLSNFGLVRLGPRDVRLSESDVVEPDLFAFRNVQRGQSTERVFYGAPAFVVEIMSPSSAVNDRVRKASLYMNTKVEEYWVVDPFAKRILVHLLNRQGANPEIFIDRPVRSHIIPTFEVDLTELFAPEPESGE